MSLVDQYGKPLKKEVLLQEQAGPSMAGIRSILSSHPTKGLNPQRLASILLGSEQGNTEAYLALAEELEEKDPHYLSIIRTRKMAVSQLEITVEPASDDKNDIENANLIEEFLNRDQLQGELFDILDAVGKGASFTEIIWDLSESQWMPKDLVWRDPRWFIFDRDDGVTPYLNEGGNEVPLAPYKFIYHQHKSKSGIPIRGGVVRPCAWMWLFKNFSVKDWVIFAEAYGQPVRLGKYNAGASKEDRDILLKAVAQIGSDAAAIIPESMQIEFIEAQQKTGTADVFERLCNFADQQMSKAVLGQTTTTDAISGGHAVSKEHNKVREDIEAADAKMLASTLNRDLVVPIITLNRGAQKKYPRIFIGRTEDVDLNMQTTAVDRFVRMGGRVSMSKMAERLGMPVPDNEKDVLRPLAESPQGSSGTNNEPAETASQKVTATQRKPDAIDSAVDDLEGDWEELMTPAVQQLEDLIAQSSSYEDFQARLAGVDLKLEPVAERLAKQLFSARVAGNHALEVK